MDLASAATQTPDVFASAAQTWLRWRYSPIAEVQATHDADGFVRHLGFPSAAHFFRPFFLFTEPVSLRGANEHSLPPTALHMRLMPQDRIREVDASIRAAYFAKTLAECGEAELRRYERDVFPLLRRIAAQGARDDDLASGEVPLHSMLDGDVAFNAELREALWRSNKVREIIEQEQGGGGGEGGDAAAALAVQQSNATAILAPRTAPGIGAVRPVLSPQDTLHPPPPSPVRPAQFQQQQQQQQAASGPAADAETLLRASYSTWFASFIRDYHSAVRFSHFDPVDFPIAQVFVVTSSYLNQPTHPDCNIVASLQRLIELSRVHAATQWAPWINISLDRMNMVRVVFILHDPESEIADKTVEAVQGRIQSEICGASGGACYVVRIAGHNKRSRDSNQNTGPTASPLVLRPWLNANSLHYIDDYAAAVERLQSQLEKDHLVTAQMSLDAAIAKVDATHPAVGGIASCAGAAGLVTKKDYDDVARVVNTALRLQLLPFVDRRLRAHAQYVAENKQSAFGKFASSLFSGNDKNKLPSVVKDRENPEPRYRSDCLEMQMRRAGDLSMALQDYNGALFFYKAARDEWKETLAAREFNRPLLGAVKEALGVCLLLTGKLTLPPNAADLKRDPEAARFEAARDDFRAARVQNYAFRVSQLLIQMCREAKTPAHDRGVVAITGGVVNAGGSSSAQIQHMSPFYQGIMHEQLALFHLAASSPPVPLVPGINGSGAFLRNYLTVDVASAVACRPRLFARSMLEAAKRFGDMAGLGRHATRCALAAWHVLRYRLGRSESFPLVVADTALFLAKRCVVDGDPLGAAGFLAFALHACSPAVHAASSTLGAPRIPSALHTTMLRVLKDCVQRAVQRHGTTHPGDSRRHVLVHSTLPLFAYSLVAVVSDGLAQDAATISGIAAQQQQQQQAAFAVGGGGGGPVPAMTTAQADFDVECDRLYDDVKEQYSGSSIHCPRNLDQYRQLFSKPHTEKTGARSLTHQKHHYDDLFLPQPPPRRRAEAADDDGFGFSSSMSSGGGGKDEADQQTRFYSTSQDEPLHIRVGLRSRFACYLKRIRLLYVELCAEDRNNSGTSAENGDGGGAAAAAAAASTQQDGKNSGGGSEAAFDVLLVGAGARRVPHSEIREGEVAVERFFVPGPSAGLAAPPQFSTPPHASNPNPHLTFLVADDSAATVSVTLPCTFRSRGTFAIVGFRYELEIVTANNKTHEGGITTFESLSASGPAAGADDSDDDDVNGSRSTAVLHNALLPCLHLQHLAYHEGVHNFVGSSSDTIAAFSGGGPQKDPALAGTLVRGLERGDVAVAPPPPLHRGMPMLCEEQLMAHAANVFAAGIPATHPSYIYVHVRAPVPMLSLEFNPPLPTACRSGELFSTQLIIRNVSKPVAASPHSLSASSAVHAVAAAADHVRVYISECCGHMFALDSIAGNPRKQQQRAEAEEKLLLGSASTAAVVAAAPAAAGKAKPKAKQQKGKAAPQSKGASDLLAEWTRVASSDEHKQQNTGGMIRISIPRLEPGVACTFNCLFRAQGNEFLRNSNVSKSVSAAAPDHDVVSVALFASWMMPRGYLVHGTDPKAAPSISAAMLRCCRFYRRVLVLPSIGIAPRCVPLISTKPLRPVGVASADGGAAAGAATKKDDAGAAAAGAPALAPQVALSIEIRSEKKATSRAGGAAQPASPASGTKGDSFFVIDDVSIVSAGWTVKCLTAASAKGPKNSTIAAKQLESRSVTGSTNWSCAALLTRRRAGDDAVSTPFSAADATTKKTAPSLRWSTTTLVPRVSVAPLDTSSSDGASSSSSSSSSDDDDDDDHNCSRPTFSRRRPLLPSRQALLHFAVTAPASGSGIFGRPPIVAEGLAFFLDSAEKGNNAKSNSDGGNTAQSPFTPSPAASAMGGGGSEGAFPSEAPPRDPFQKELLALPDEFGANEKLPVLLRVSWREVTVSAAASPTGEAAAGAGAGSTHVVIRRGVTFDVVHVADEALQPTATSAADALFDFRERLRAEHTFRRENQGHSSPPGSPASPAVKSALEYMLKLSASNGNNGGSSSSSSSALVVPSSIPRDVALQMVPRVLCALSAPQSRVYSAFTETGFAAEIPVHVAVSNLSPFPVLVSIYATPRYSGGGVPVLFSGRHAFTDILVPPSETVSNLRFVAVALCPGVVDVASGCFAFDVVNALLHPSTRPKTGGPNSSAAAAAAVKFTASSAQRSIVGSSPTAPFPPMSPTRVHQQQHQQQSASTAGGQLVLPAPVVVFGPVGGTPHSSLVRVEALRTRVVQPQSAAVETAQQQQQQQQQNDNAAGRSILDVSFSSRAHAESVAAAAAAAVASSASGAPEQQQMQVRRRGERSASRVVRNADGSSFVPLRMELPASPATVSAATATSAATPTGAAAAAAGPATPADTPTVASDASAAPASFADAEAGRGRAASDSAQDGALPLQQQMTSSADDATTEERADDGGAATPRPPPPPPTAAEDEPHAAEQQDETSSAGAAAGSAPAEQPAGGGAAVDPPPAEKQPAVPVAPANSSGNARPRADSEPSSIDLIAARVIGGRTDARVAAVTASSSSSAQTSAAASPAAKATAQSVGGTGTMGSPTTSKVNNVFASSSSSSSDDDDDDAAAADLIASRARTQSDSAPSSSSGGGGVKPRLPSDLFDTPSTGTASPATAGSGLGASEQKKEKKPSNASFRKNRFATSSDDDS